MIHQTFLGQPQELNKNDERQKKEIKDSCLTVKSEPNPQRSVVVSAAYECWSEPARKRIPLNRI